MSISPSVVRANNSSLRGYLAVFRGAQVLEATLTANPTRESFVAGLLNGNPLDLSDLRVTYSPSEHTGLKLVDLAIVTREGRFRH